MQDMHACKTLDHEGVTLTTPIRFRADVLTERAEAMGDSTLHLIATRTGLRESTISRLMTGRTTPTLLTLAAIASAYGTTLDALVTGLVQAAPTVPAQRTGVAA